ncbi:hypothetical protein PoB_000019400 [Plakobranchus ocellatus]|uniref:Uncharacterized protein n=1 Tax=Plakobranchus ocellatus TaxID=259542 RepID=A0AAV3XV97_9GAST|nr:hypothetical protein PoB_000019400 [Plakobranchus ocellatus]
MFSSPSSTYTSPRLSIHTGVVGQFGQFPDSPSDSRVPWTPNVKPQDVILDQSVPLSPLGGSVVQHASPESSALTVPNTPRRTFSLPHSTLSQSAVSQFSPSLTGVLNTSGSTQPDQLVPSTPNKLYKGNQSCRPITEQFTSSPLLPLSNMPICNHNNYITLDSLSPVAFTSFDRPFSPSVESTDESGYHSTSLEKKNKIVESKESGLKDDTQFLLKPRKTFMSRTFQPPSRRRLSLSQHGNRDTVQQDHSFNPFILTDDTTSSAYQTYSELSKFSMGQENLEFNGKVVTPLLPLDGDGSNLPANQRSKIMHQKTAKLNELLKTVSATGVVIAPHKDASTSKDVRVSCEKKPKEVLDLFSDDNIFG